MLCYYVLIQHGFRTNKSTVTAITDVYRFLINNWLRAVHFTTTKPGENWNEKWFSPYLSDRLQFVETSLSTKKRHINQLCYQLQLAFHKPQLTNLLYFRYYHWLIFFLQNYTLTRYVDDDTTVLLGAISENIQDATNAMLYNLLNGLPPIFFWIYLKKTNYVSFTYSTTCTLLPLAITIVNQSMNQTFQLKLLLLPSLLTLDGRMFVFKLTCIFYIDMSYCYFYILWVYKLN